MEIFNNWKANWTGPSAECFARSQVLSPSEFFALRERLSMNGELPLEQVKSLQYLAAARCILVDTNLSECETANVWAARCAMVHQRVLCANSAELHDEAIKFYARAVSSLAPLPSAASTNSVTNNLYALVCLEQALVHSHYGERSLTSKALTIARDSLGIKIQMTGAMGKRTKFQEKDTPQLLLSVIDNRQTEGSPCSCNCKLPTEVELEEDSPLRGT